MLLCCASHYRCLVEDAGEVAFIKHTIVPENSNGERLTLTCLNLSYECVIYINLNHPPPLLVKGNGPAWASGVNADDYQLICPGQAAPVEISEYAKCNLAAVPAHAVVTRPETHSEVVRILREQQVSDDLGHEA